VDRYQRTPGQQGVARKIPVAQNRVTFVFRAKSDIQASMNPGRNAAAPPGEAMQRIAQTCCPQQFYHNSLLWGHQGEAGALLDHVPNAQHTCAPQIRR